VFKRIQKLCVELALWMLVGMSVIVFVDIILRFFLRRSLPWGVEVCEYFIFGLTYLAASYLLREGKHVRIEIIESFIKETVKKRLEKCREFIGLLFCIVVCIISIEAAYYSYKMKLKVTRIYAVDKYIFLLIIAFGFGMLALEFLRKLIITLRQK